MRFLITLIFVTFIVILIIDPSAALPLFLIMTAILAVLYMLIRFYVGLIKSLSRLVEWSIMKVFNLLLSFLKAINNSLRDKIGDWIFATSLHRLRSWFGRLWYNLFRLIKYIWLISSGIVKWSVMKVFNLLLSFLKAINNSLRDKIGDWIFATSLHRLRSWFGRLWYNLFRLIKYNWLISSVRQFFGWLHYRLFP